MGVVHAVGLAALRAGRCVQRAADLTRIVARRLNVSRIASQSEPRSQPLQHKGVAV